MKLPSRLSQLFQKESDRFLKDFLADNPDLLTKYVNGSLSAVSAILAPVNVFMRHLLIVQGLDPDSNPGAAKRAELYAALDTVFEKNHDKDFDDDYDVSWVHKKYDSVKDKLNVSEDAFMALTDLSRLESKPLDLSKEKFDNVAQLVNPVAPEAEKRELPLIPDPIEALRAAVFGIEKELGVAEPKRKKLNKTTKSRSKNKGAKVKRVPNTTPIVEEPSTLKVESDRKVRPNWKKTPSRNLSDLAAAKKSQIKAAKEATPEFQADLKAKIARATELTNLMIEKGLLEPGDKARQEQINQMISWGDNNFDALERVIRKYAPTKNAIAENKFKGSFRRIEK